MSRTTRSATETSAERVRRVLEHTRGTMPVTIAASSPGEAEELRQALASSRSRARSLISVELLEQAPPRSPLRRGN